MSDRVVGVHDPGKLLVDPSTSGHWCVTRRGGYTAGSAYIPEYLETRWCNDAACFGDEER